MVASETCLYTEHRGRAVRGRAPRPRGRRSRPAAARAFSSRPRPAGGPRRSRRRRWGRRSRDRGRRRRGDRRGPLGARRRALSSRSAAPGTWPSASARRSTSSRRTSCAATPGASRRRSARAGRAVPAAAVDQGEPVAGAAADPHRGGNRLRRLRRRASSRRRCAPAPTPSRISLNGPMKDEALLERAMRAGVRITLDSRAELARAAAAAERIGRTRDGPASPPPRPRRLRRAVGDVAGGALGPRRAPALQGRDPDRGPARDHRRGDRRAVDSSSPACTCTSGATRPTPRCGERRSTTLANLIAALRERWNGWSPRELDLGGGFPAPRDPFGRLLEQRSDAPDRSPPLGRVRGGDLPAPGATARPTRGSTLRASGSSSSRVGRSTPTPGSTWRRSATSSARRARPR